MGRQARRAGVDVAAAAAVAAAVVAAVGRRAVAVGPVDLEGMAAKALMASCWWSIEVLMSRGVLVLLFMAWPMVAFAQHPCDVVPPTNPAVASPVKLGFCVPQTTAQQVTAYKVYLDASPTASFTGPLTPIGAPNAGGLVYLEAPAIVVTQGNHSAQASAVNVAGEGAKSVAYPFAVIGPPVAPSNLRIAP